MIRIFLLLQTSTNLLARLVFSVYYYNDIWNSHNIYYYGQGSLSTRTLRLQYTSYINTGKGERTFMWEQQEALFSFLLLPHIIYQLDSLQQKYAQAVGSRIFQILMMCKPIPSSILLKLGINCNKREQVDYQAKEDIATKTFTKFITRKHVVVVLLLVL